MTSEQVKVERIREGSAPVWLIDAPFDPYTAPLSDIGIATTLLNSNFGCTFRAVPIERLPLVLKNGIDIEPTNGPIWVGDFAKAWEYGGFPKVVMALEWNRLGPSFVSTLRDGGQRSVEELKERYPYVTEVGDELWFSLVENPNPGYEVPYGRQVLGSPHDALVAVIIFGATEDVKTYLP